MPSKSCGRCGIDLIDYTDDEVILVQRGNGHSDYLICFTCYTRTFDPMVQLDLFK